MDGVSGRVIGWGIALLLVIVLWLWWWLRDRAPRFAAKPLLTKNELEFYHRLRQAVPELQIFPQVAMNAFLRPLTEGNSDSYASIRARFAQKHVDFLLCEPQSLEIYVIVELDDRTHSISRDEERDAMTGEAGYRTLRISSREKPSVAELRECVREILEMPAGTRWVTYSPEGYLAD